MKGKHLPPDHHVVRYVSPGRLRKDENQKVVGILHTAFERPESHKGLSVTWLEYFAGTPLEQRTAAVQAIRASDMTPSKNGGFAVGNVEAIRKAGAERRHKIRIVHWPVDDNKAHAELRQLPRDDLELFERLAVKEWSELLMNTDVAAGEKAAPDEPAS
jgi:hypothetical protein